VGSTPSAVPSPDGEAGDARGTLAGSPPAPPPERGTAVAIWAEVAGLVTRRGLLPAWRFFAQWALKRRGRIAEWRVTAYRMGRPLQTTVRVKPVPPRPPGLNGEGNLGKRRR